MLWFVQLFELLYKYDMGVETLKRAPTALFGKLKNFKPVRIYSQY